MKAKSRTSAWLPGTACLAAAAIAFCAQAQTNAPSRSVTVDGNPATNSAGSDTGVSGAIDRKPLLTPAQRSALYAEVSKDPSKSSPRHFATEVGADVPPMIELYNLPDDAAAVAPAVKFYKYTMVEDKVVVVDPTKMRIVDVIGPSPKQ